MKQNFLSDIHLANIGRWQTNYSQLSIYKNRVQFWTTQAKCLTCFSIQSRLNTSSFSLKPITLTNSFVVCKYNFNRQIWGETPISPAVSRFQERPVCSFCSWSPRVMLVCVKPISFALSQKMNGWTNKRGPSSKNKIQHCSFCMNPEKWAGGELSESRINEDNKCWQGQFFLGDREYVMQLNFLQFLYGIKIETMEHHNSFLALWYIFIVGTSVGGFKKRIV